MNNVSREVHAITQRQRGQILVIVFVVVFLGFLTTNWWASRQADRRASLTSARLREALPAYDLLDLRLGADGLARTFPIRSVIEEPGGVRVNVEVSSLWQLRCIVGHVNPEKEVVIRTFGRGCQG